MWTLKRVLRLMFAAEEYRQRHSSVDEALAHDWMMVQRDGQAAYEKLKRKHELSEKEQGE